MRRQVSALIVEATDHAVAVAALSRLHAKAEAQATEKNRSDLRESRKQVWDATTALRRGTLALSVLIGGKHELVARMDAVTRASAKVAHAKTADESAEAATEYGDTLSVAITRASRLIGANVDT
jgi:hypothetical protein